MDDPRRRRDGRRDDQRMPARAEHLTRNEAAAAAAPRPARQQHREASYRRRNSSERPLRRESSERRPRRESSERRKQRGESGDREKRRSRRESSSREGVRAGGRGGRQQSRRRESSERDRSSATKDSNGSRRTSTHPSRESSRPATRTDDEARRPPPTITRVPQRQSRAARPTQRNGPAYAPVPTHLDRPNHAHVYVPMHMDGDGGADSPDARLMGTRGLERGRSRKKKRPDPDLDSDPEPEPPAAAVPSRMPTHRSQRAVGGGVGAEEVLNGKSRGKTKVRPLSADSDDSGLPPMPSRKRKCGKRFWILLGLTLLLLIIFIPVGVVVSKKNKGGTAATASTDTKDKTDTAKYGENSQLPDASTIPAAYKNTYLDPYVWKDTKDFNLTFTDKIVGGLSVMGLFDEYDDTIQANDNVPPLNKAWEYGKMPVRGVNLGGWLIVEPFITPSFFRSYAEPLGVVDEYTLSAKLGAKGAAEFLENHYSTFVTEQTFKEIRAAGLDHVRLPFGYWAVQTYDDAPAFVPKISWRYLLRAIEWARKYGLRVKLDLHSVPGGANGWNHSGRLGVMNWLNGVDGDKNGDRTLKIHAQLAEFFSQPRYKNIVTMYGLVNEPKMITLDPDKVISWSKDAYKVIRDKGYKGKIIFGDGFRGLSSWKGEFSGMEGMVLDVHEYVIFNTMQIQMDHRGKINFACDDWGAQLSNSVDTSKGFGPTIVGEWGQADTDCTEYLNNVRVGSRWEGKLNAPDAKILTPLCNGGKNCSCAMPNGDPADYTDAYRKFLLMFAEAQMNAFEKGWGWLYWTWDTESATQWSYKKSLAAKIIPQKAYKRSFNCDSDVPDFLAMGLPEGN